jgi:hypothetical protein
MDFLELILVLLKSLKIRAAGILAQSFGGYEPSRNRVVVPARQYNSISFQQQQSTYIQIMAALKENIFLV